MESLYADRTANVSEFKISPLAVMQAAQGKPIAVLNHGRPAFYAVPPAQYEALVRTRDQVPA